MAIKQKEKVPIKQSEANEQLRQNVIKYAEFYNDFNSQIEQEKISLKKKIRDLTANSHNKINSLKIDMKDFSRKIADGNKSLTRHKLEPIQFTPAVKRIKKVGNPTPAPQTP
jgi:hypothetical protein